MFNTIILVIPVVWMTHAKFCAHSYMCRLTMVDVEKFLLKVECLLYHPVGCWAVTVFPCSLVHVNKSFPASTIVTLSSYFHYMW